MSIRKPNFPAFWLPVVLVSFAPLLGHSADKQQISSVSAVCSLPADAPAPFKARFAAADMTQKQAICANIAAKDAARKAAAAQNAPAANDAITATAAMTSPPDDSQIPVNDNSQATKDFLQKLKDQAAAAQNAPANKSATISNDGGLSPTAPVSNQTVPPSNKAHYLSSAEAQMLFPDLAILTLPDGAKGDGTTSNKPTAAFLTSKYPNACKDNFSLSTTANDGTLKGPSGVIGFTIFDKGGLAQCMTANAKVCDQDYDNSQCSSMSDLASLKIPQNAAIHVAYLDAGKARDAKVSMGSWSASDINGAMNILSDAQIQNKHDQDETDKEQRRESNLSSCMNLQDLPIAQQLIDGIMDPVAKAKFNDQASALVAKKNQQQGNKDLAAIDKAIEEASQADDEKPAEDVEKRIYDFAKSHPSQKDAAADRLEMLVRNLTGGQDGPSLADTPSAAKIKAAKRMLSDAMSDDSDLNLSDAKQAEYNKFSTTLMPLREVQSSVYRVYNLELLAQSLAQKDPSKAQRASTQAANEEKNAEKLQKSAITNYTNLLKKMGCIKVTRTYMGNAEQDTAKSEDNDTLGDACGDIKSDRTEVENVVAQAQKEAVAAQQQLVKNQQAAYAAQMKQGQAGQQGQIPQLVPPNMQFGPSLAGNMGAMGGMPSMNLPTQMPGSYNAGYMQTSPQMMTSGMPVMQYNPYNYMGSAGQYGPQMGAMPIMGGGGGQRL